MHSQNDTVSNTSLKDFWLSNLKNSSFCVMKLSNYIIFRIIITLSHNIIKLSHHIINISHNIIKISHNMIQLSHNIIKASHTIIIIRSTFIEPSVFRNINMRRQSWSYNSDPSR